MFYLNRDVPSEFMANLTEQQNPTVDNYADQNPLDQNIRSGSGFEQFTYAQILAGQNTNPPTKEAKETSEIKAIGGIDYKSDIQANKDLDNIPGTG